MRSILIRRTAMVAGAALVFILFMRTAFGMGGLSSAQLILGTAAVVLAYIVVRLSETMFAATAIERRKARRRLIIVAAIPAIVLTPTAIGSSPPDFAPMILMASVVWVALAMSYTSFILGSAAREGAPRVVGRGQSQPHDPLRPKSLTYRTHRPDRIAR